MNKGNLSTVQMFTVVVLRVLIGWHFLYEGLAKLDLGRLVGEGLSPAGPRAAGGAVPLDGRGPGATGPGEPAQHVGAHPHRARAHPRLLHPPRQPPPASSSSCCSTCATPRSSGYFYSIPTEGSYLIVNKNLVEVAALAVILVTGSGRAAGLDRIIHGLLEKRSPAERVTTRGTVVLN